MHEFYEERIERIEEAITYIIILIAALLLIIWLSAVDIEESIKEVEETQCEQISGQN